LFRLRVPDCFCKSNSSRWSKFDPLYTLIWGRVKIFSFLKHNLLQQFPYSPSQLVGPTMPCHLLLPSPKSRIFGCEAATRYGREAARLPGGEPTRPPSGEAASHGCKTAGPPALRRGRAPWPQGRRPARPLACGFDVIDAAKAAVEQSCPCTISCADIIAFAPRDSVTLTGSVSYQVPAGRRDGHVSKASDTLNNLSPPAHIHGDGDGEDTVGPPLPTPTAMGTVRITDSGADEPWRHVVPRRRRAFGTWLRR
jgi:hypothetical protein